MQIMRGAKLLIEFLVDMRTIDVHGYLVLGGGRFPDGPRPESVALRRVCHFLFVFLVPIVDFEGILEIE